MIWNVKNIDRQPSVVLHQWKIMELPNGDRHFVGYEPDFFQGRASSKIISFDKENMRGVTRSGRVYQLVGPPGTNSDADYVWSRWKNINNETSDKDVSGEI